MSEILNAVKDPDNGSKKSGTGVKVTDSKKVVNDGGDGATETSDKDYSQTVSEVAGLVGDTADAIGINVSTYAEDDDKQRAAEKAEAWKERMWEQDMKVYKDNQIKYGKEFALKEYQLRTGLSAAKINESFSNLGQRQALLKSGFGDEIDQKMKKNMAAFMKGFSGSMAGAY
jgi:hypothetical protein